MPLPTYLIQILKLYYNNLNDNKKSDLKINRFFYIQISTLSTCYLFQNQQQTVPIRYLLKDVSTNHK